jgi:hypothetical protein
MSSVISSLKLSSNYGGVSTQGAQWRPEGVAGYGKHQQNYNYWQSGKRT